MIGIPLSALLHVLVVAGVGLRILHRRLAVSTTTAWLVVIAALPIAGLVLYFLFGDHRLGRKRLKKGPQIRQYYQSAYEISKSDVSDADMDVSPFFRDLSDVVSHETGFHPSMGNKIELLEEGHLIIDAIADDIDNANDTCFLEFYIIETDGRVKIVMEALLRAAARGVDCRILVDAIGSRGFLAGKWAEKLRSAGVDIEASLGVNPLKMVSTRTDLRNHRKIVIVDQNIGYVGSFNLVDPAVFKQSAGVGEWVDVMVRLEGHVVSSLSVVFNTDFLFDSNGENVEYSELHKFPGQTPSREYARDAVMQLIPSGPEMGTSLIYEVIVSAIYGARNSIKIVTPYFVPDEALLLALSNAARRGLEVTILLPHKIDSRLARYAGQSVFDDLLEAGVKIARYHGGMLHTKALLIDDDVSFVGTVNMDMRSFYLNLEVTLAVYDKSFATLLSKTVKNYLKDSVFIEQDFWRERPLRAKLKENVFRLATPLL